jgi:hypothetical protein
MDGTGSGDNYWSKTFTGGTPGAEETWYLTVTTSEPDVGPFLQIGDGAATVATASGEIAATGLRDGSGDLLVRWGVQNLAAANGGVLFADTLNYASTAAMQAGGWTKNESGGATLSVETSDTHGQSAVVKANLNSGSGSAYWSRTLTGTAGKQYDISIWGKRNPTSGFQVRHRRAARVRPRRRYPLPGRLGAQDAPVVGARGRRRAGHPVRPVRGLLRHPAVVVAAL